MKLGIHAYAWCLEWSNDTLNQVRNSQHSALDFIELPLVCLETLERQWRACATRGWAPAPRRSCSAGTDIT